MRAVVDIGSNAVKFLAAETSSQRSRVLDQGRFLTRLGAGIDSQGRLSAAALRETGNALKRIRRSLESRRMLAGGRLEMRVVATSAVRESSNSNEVAQLVEEILDAPLTILSGRQEARFSMAGAEASARTLLDGEPSLFIEVGGGSTQLGRLQPRFSAVSFQAGAVRCHRELGFAAGPIRDAQWEEAKKRMEAFFPQRRMEDLLEALGRLDPKMAAALGGVSVLSAQAAQSVGQPAGSLADAASLMRAADSLRRLDMKQRRERLPGVETKRLDILPAGILCLATPLSMLGIERLAITAQGLRHGILRMWNEFDRLTAQETDASPLQDQPGSGSGRD